MIDGDLLEEARGGGLLPRPEHVYLKSNFDLLGQRALREQCLDLEPEARVSNPTIELTSSENVIIYNKSS